MPPALSVGAGVPRLNEVRTPDGTLKLIQPMFSPPAKPRKRPLGSMTTPAPSGAKLIHPTFSPQANPDRRPSPSIITPPSTGLRLIQPMFSAQANPRTALLVTVT